MKWITNRLANRFNRRYRINWDQCRLLAEIALERIGKVGI